MGARRDIFKSNECGVVDDDAVDSECVGGGVRVFEV